MSPPVTRLTVLHAPLHSFIGLLMWRQGDRLVFVGREKCMVKEVRGLERDERQ